MNKKKRGRPRAEPAVIKSVMFRKSVIKRAVAAGLYGKGRPWKTFSVAVRELFEAGVARAEDLRAGSGDGKTEGH